MSFSILGDLLPLAMTGVFIFNVITLVAIAAGSFYTINLIIKEHKTTIKQWIFFTLLYIVGIIGSYYVSYNPYILSVDELKKYSLDSLEILSFNYQIFCAYYNFYLLIGCIFVSLIFYQLYKRQKTHTNSSNLMTIIITLFAFSPLVLMVNFILESSLFKITPQIIILYPYIISIIALISLVLNTIIIIFNNKTKTTSTSSTLKK